MKVKFSSYLEIDTDHIPDDFDELVLKAFQKFTIGTSKDYTYQDKLLFIDTMRIHLHKADDADERVRELMHEMLDYEVKEHGDFPQREDYLSIEFMSSCYDAGRTNLYAQYTRDRNVNEAIMHLLVRAIKVVINY